MTLVIEDFGSIFSINSTFMDVIEPNFLEQHWFILGGLIALLGVASGPYLYWLSEIRYPYSGGVFLDILGIAASVFFAYWARRSLSGYLFGLECRPIRFHRGAKKIYAMRSRRSVGRGEGDVVWEAAWDSKAIYCLHREDTQFGAVFHIRHYQIDDQGKVVRVFSLGRAWVGEGAVAEAWSQWGYFCKYMNDGPDGLPKPLLFHARKETLREAFYFSLRSLELRKISFLCVLLMPLILLFTGLRYAANATCRAPIWPPEIKSISAIESDDPFQEPKAGTPLGWVATALARRRGELPVKHESTGQR